MKDLLASLREAFTIGLNVLVVGGVLLMLFTGVVWVLRHV